MEEDVPIGHKGQSLKDVIRVKGSKDHADTLEAPKAIDTPIVDITVISAIGFYFNIYRKDNKVFTTSLYKINRIIAKMEEGLVEETDKELVKRLLPTYLLCYRDAFLKVASDILPPY